MSIKEVFLNQDVRHITSQLTDAIKKTGRNKNVNLEGIIGDVVDKFPDDLVLKGISAKYFLSVRDFEKVLEIAPDTDVGNALKMHAYIGLCKYDSVLLMPLEGFVGLYLKSKASFLKGDLDSGRNFYTLLLKEAEVHKPTLQNMLSLGFQLFEEGHRVRLILETTFRNERGLVERAKRDAGEKPEFKSMMGRTSFDHFREYGVNGVDVNSRYLVGTQAKGYINQ